MSVPETTDDAAGSDAPSEPRSRFQKLISNSWIVVGIPALFGLIELSWTFQPTNDALCYLSIARSIAEGGPAANLGSQRLFYNPGYPLVIAPCFLTSEFPFLLISLVHWGLFVGFLHQTFRWAKRMLPDLAGPVTLLVGSSVMLKIGWQHFLSEIAFMFVLMALVNVVATARRQRGAGDIWIWAVAVTLAAALVLIRPAGAICVAGIAFAVAYFDGLRPMLRRNRNSGNVSEGDTRRARLWGPVAASFCLVLAAVGAELGVMAYERSQPGEVRKSYAEYLIDTVTSPGRFATAVADGITWRSQEIWQMLIPGLFKADNDPSQWWGFPLLCFYLVWAFCLSQGWWSLARRGDVFAWTLPPYLALHLIWPFDGGGRFMLPMIGLLAACWARSDILWLLIPRYRVPVLVGCAVLHLAIGFGHWIARDVPQRIELTQSMQELERLMDQIEHPSDDQTLLVSRGLPWREVIQLQYLLDRPVLTAEEVVNTREDKLVFAALPVERDPPIGKTVLARTDRYVVYAESKDSPPPSLPDK
ncbi:hypothetical protein [Stratiformator vulcanicus]|uniref:Glycosyltransferase RgtA/B/C/D-like domain-containing protein n=1 Tax=Stratiformator vulcanicus TaxID=2527980 RepID=A0A517QWS9_9PLAN|nr:hypothetical protein [Stratiformator vulcanicus]QDT36125.1 hypothetical protein Pan189_04800 [Stratiformator vulcanicus]